MAIQQYSRETVNSREVEMEQEGRASISQEMIEQLYQNALTAYQLGKYQESVSLFIFLTTLKPYEHRFWLGLGIAEQHNKQYESALVAFDMAAWADGTNPISYLYVADCFLSIEGGKELALQALKKAVELCGKGRRFLHIKQEAKHRQALLQKAEYKDK